MKINILYDFVHGPWGGANQFLAALRNGWRRSGVYSNANDADVVMLNSHTGAWRCILLKLFRPGLIVVHRIDGPIQLARGATGEDRIVQATCALLADGAVFQSNWSRRENLALGLKEPAYATVIVNAPDPEIFYPARRKEKNAKVRIIASSWSGNARKGFDAFSWLDAHLDFSRYSFIFVGNSPRQFNNISVVPPQPSQALAEMLRQSDVYLLASKAEGCSNALLEALHCGLPAIVRNASSNPELTGESDLLFMEAEEIPALLEKLAAGYERYVAAISVRSLDEVGAAYYAFCAKIHKDASTGGYRPKRLRCSGLCRFAWIFFAVRFCAPALRKVRKILAKH